MVIRKIKISAALVLIFLSTGSSCFAQTFAQEQAQMVLDEKASTVAVGSQEQFQAMPTEMLPPDSFELAVVKKIVKETIDDTTGTPMPVQDVILEMTGGAEKGKTIEVSHGSVFVIHQDQKVTAGETVVLSKTTASDGSPAYHIYDKYRLPPVFFIAVIFFILVAIFGGKRGIGSIVGMAVSIGVLAYYIVPHILMGENPLLVSFIGSIFIATIAIFLAHGFNKRTTIAFASTILTLGISLVLSIIFVKLTNLSGAGTEEAFYLQFGPLEKLNLQGLLLGGILIGALGVLDDVTTGQCAAVHEIHRANPSLKFKDLYKRGLSVGREHIASLVNTLVLAYAGASLPLFLVFNDPTFPLWVNFNTEFIIEEVVRTLVGSTTLVFAVPISTLLAAYFFSKKPDLKGHQRYNSRHSHA